jgi:predicted NAD/FAD-binding protein
MKIAVIGAGVSGLGAAWLLSRRHDVVVYERENRFGGHSCTVEAPTKQGRLPVDVGFIVYNERNYPNLIALFDHLGVPTEPSDMSFAVSLDEGGFEYASSFAGYFAQRSNLARPSFLRMTHDILRFNRMAPQLLDRAEDLDFTIGDFIEQAGFGEAFRDRYLVPMAACIWSTPLGRMLDYPAQTFARFFNNHGLLTIGPQLQWRTVSGGSRSYVERIVAPLRARARLATPASAIRRLGEGVEVRDAGGHWDRFDRVVLACHADQALSLLTDADQTERDLLGSFAYSTNDGLAPWRSSASCRSRRDVWASWNYVADSRSRPTATASVTYWMNRLQNFSHDSAPLFVSVNPDPSCPTPATGPCPASPSSIRCTIAAAIRAQRRICIEIQGVRDTYFCGSYCGYGFHEDALSAGLDVAEQLGARRPVGRVRDEHRRDRRRPRASSPTRPREPARCRCRSPPAPLPMTP